MLIRFNHLLDTLSDYFAARKGLLPLLGILLIVVNAVLQFTSGASLLAQTDLLLHIGVILAILGVLLAWAL